MLGIQTQVLRPVLLARELCRTGHMGYSGNRSVVLSIWLEPKMAIEMSSSKIMVKTGDIKGDISQEQKGNLWNSCNISKYTDSKKGK